MRFSSSCNEDVISFQNDLISPFNRFDCDLTMSSMIYTSEDFVAGQNFDALLGKYFIESFCNLFINSGHNFI